MTQQFARGVFTEDSVSKTLLNDYQLLSASGAMPVVSGRYLITKAGIAALTLAAPAVGAQDGAYIEVQSTTAFAHTLTATGLFQDGAGHVNLATFAAFAGAGLKFVAYQGKWMVERVQGVTMS
jgi:hypothetical protein